MRKITSTLGELEAIANKFGTSIPELVNLHGRPELPPVKQDAHVNCQFIGEWLNGCNSHIELWHEHIENTEYAGTPILTQYSNIW